MSVKKIPWPIFSCLVLVSCATPALWDATNPREYVAMTRNEKNETKLKTSGLNYRIDEEWDLFYVEKSTLQKSRDYAIRTIGTPVTVVLDAASTIVVVGAAIYVLSHSNGYFPDIAPYSAEQKEWKSMQTTLESMRKEERHNPDSSPVDTGLSQPMPY